MEHFRPAKYLNKTFSAWVRLSIPVSIPIICGFHKKDASWAKASALEGKVDKREDKKKVSTEQIGFRDQKRSRSRRWRR
jgi:hypothetical protein